MDFSDVILPSSLFSVPLFGKAQTSKFHVTMSVEPSLLWLAKCFFGLLRVVFYVRVFSHLKMERNVLFICINVAALEWAVYRIENCVWLNEVFVSFRVWRTRDLMKPKKKSIFNSRIIYDCLCWFRHMVNYVEHRSLTTHNENSVEKKNFCCNRFWLIFSLYLSSG